MMRQREIIDLGEQLLNMNPDPVPKFRIIRDVLKIPQIDNRYIEAIIVALIVNLSISKKR